MAEDSRYHVFLSHNSADKPVVAELACQLVKEGIQPWLDLWNLIPGEPWQEAIEKALRSCATCAVFVGPSGTGPWQNEEMRAAIDRRVGEKGFRVIPVLLPGAERPERSRLPDFLVRTTWVEFRTTLKDADAFHRLICGIRGVEPGSGPGRDVYEGQCPYRGLRYFDVEHAPFFFGREALTQWLVEGLRASHFLAVIGPSGSGKSSAVRAGLVPALRSGALPGSATWTIVTMRPGMHPLGELAAHLVVLLGDAGDRVAAMLRLQDSLRSDNRALHAAVRLAAGEAGMAPCVLIVVDQFEELFTLCQDEEERWRFLDNLLYASGVVQGRTAVVLAMRADFYARAATYPELADRMADQVLVTPMRKDELRQAIEAPAQRVGLAFDAGLVDTILADVANEPGGLPLLKHALLELWQRRQGRQLTFAAYHETGGVEGAIARRAEEEYAALTPEQQAVARRILLRLVQPGEGTVDTRRRARLDELAPDAAHVAEVEAVVHRLADARLLTTGREEASTAEMVDVAHEALIQSWPRLREWIERDREALHTQRRLADAALEWQRRGKDNSDLYRGARLTEAEEWAAEHAGDLNPQERAFLDASLALRDWDKAEREAQRRRELEAAQRLAQAERRRVQWAIMIGAIAVVLAGFAIWFGIRSTQNARRAQARDLASQAIANVEARPQLSVLLALEAISTTMELDGYYLPKAEESLRQVLGAIGGMPLPGRKGSVRVLAFSPDSRLLAAGTSEPGILLWNTENPAIEPTILEGHKGSVRTIAFSPDGLWLASGSDDRTICLWNVQDPKASPTVLRSHNGSVGTLTFSPDGQWIATGGDDGAVLLWDVTHPTNSPTIIYRHAKPVSMVRFSHAGRWLATASSDGTASLVDMAIVAQGRGNVLPKPILLRGHTDAVQTLAFDRDDRRLATGSLDSTVRVWSMSDPAAAPTILQGHSSRVTELEFSSDGRWLASGGWDTSIKLWDAGQLGGRSLDLRGHQYAVSDLEFTPDGRWLATASEDHTVRLWDVSVSINSSLMNPIREPIVLHGHDSIVNDLAISPNARWIATGSLDGHVRLWDRQNPEIEPSVLRNQGASYTYRALATSPDGRWLAAAERWSNSIHMWDVLDLQDGPIRIAGHTLPTVDLTFSPDGRWLASANEDKTIGLVNLSRPNLDGTKVVTVAVSLQGHEGIINAVAFDPKGRWLASASGQDHSVRLWDVKDIRSQGEMTVITSSLILTRNGGPISALAFSSDAGWLVGAGDGLRIWDYRSVQSGDSTEHSPIMHLEQGSSLLSVAFSPGDEWLAAGGTDGVLRLWRVRDLTKMLEEHQEVGATKRSLHRAQIMDLAFSSDGRWLATAGGWDQSVKIIKVSDLNDDIASQSGHEPVTLSGLNFVEAVAFTPDSRFLVTANRDPGTQSRYPLTRLWRLRLEDLVSLACRTVGRNLSKAEWEEFLIDRPYRETCQ